MGRLGETSEAWGKIAAAALFSTFFLASCDGREQAVVPPEGVIELSDQFTSDFDLVNHHGASVSNTDFKGKIVIVYFGFATCPDVCPLALGALSAALNELEPAVQGEIVPVFISIDPERDTPEALKAYLAFDERLIGLTGSVEKVAAARQSFKVYARKRPLPESDLEYTMDHTSMFYVVDRSGQPRLALHDTMTPQEIAATLQRSISWR